MSEQRAKPSARRGVSLLLRLTVTGLLVAWVAPQADWSKVGEAFLRLRLDLWLAAVAVLIVTQLVSAWRWQILARPFGFERSVGQLARYYFIGMFFNLFLPTSVGGDVVRAWYLDGRSGRKLSAFVAVFVDRFSGLLVLLGLACLAVLLSPRTLPAWIPGVVWGATACAAVVLAATPWLARRGERFTRPLRNVRLALHALRAPRLLLPTTLLSAAVQAGNVVLVWLVGQAIGADIPGSYYWILVPMVSLATMLPSIGGIGVRENAMALFLAPLAVAETTAVTLSLLSFAVFVAVSLGGGVLYLCCDFPTPTAGVPDQTEAVYGSIGGGADQGRAGQHRAAA
jgi:uncharacterized membrane protein YbhN (UPF0104 family)